MTHHLSGSDDKCHHIAKKLIKLKEIFMKFPNLWDAKKEEKKYAQKKIIIQYSIYVVQQFAYVYGVLGISLFTWKNTRYGSTTFSLKNNTKPWSPKQNFFYHVHKIHNWLQNRPQIIGPSRSTRGLNFKKSLIKDRSNFILD